MLTRRITLALLTALALLVGTFVGAPTPASSSTSDPDVVPGSWIVQLKPGNDSRTEGPRLARQNGGRVGHIYTAALNGFSFKGSDRAATNLSRNPNVLRIDADRVIRTVAATTVPTGIQRIGAVTVSGTTTSRLTTVGTGVRVAVLDTGVDKNHEQLLERVKTGKSCISTEPDPTIDGNGHGTHVSGTVAGSTVGVAPAADIVPVKVLDSGGSGSWESVICGVDYVSQVNTDSTSGNEIAIANMSLGGSSSETATSCEQSSKTTLYTAICAATKNALFAVSAGNDARSADGSVPAKYPEVLTVSAFTDLDGASDPESGSECVGMGRWKDCDETFARYSNYGSIVDVMAPGTRIYSSVPGGYDTYSGTSMAAPHVAGVAALVLENDTLTVAQLEARLESTGECPNAGWASSTGSCSGSWSGDGDTIAEPMVNATRAVSNTTGGDSGGGETVNTGTVSGTVTDSLTNAAISGAVVTVDGTLTDTTDVNGDYSIADVPEGSHDVTASASGYASSTKAVSVTGGSTADLDFALAQSSSETTGYSTTTSYSPSGGPSGNKHMDITVVVVSDASGAVAGATVVADITHPKGVWARATGTTDSSGNVVFSLRNTGSGCYKTEAISVNGQSLGTEANTTFGC